MRGINFIKNKNKRKIGHRITLWYTSFVVLIFIVFSVFSILIVKEFVKSSDQRELVKHVEKIANKPSEYEYFDDGIYFLIYDKGVIKNGVLPNNFPKNVSRSLQNISMVSENGKEYLYYDAMIGNDMFVRGILPMSKSIFPLFLFSMILLISGPILVLVAYFVGRKIIEKGFKLVLNLSDSARKIENSGDFSKRLIRSENGDEIDEMASTLNDMLDSLERNYLRERQFINDVSHELRTPLTVILAEVEYIKKYYSEEEIKEIVNVIYRQTNSMKNIIQTLLDMSRIEGSIEKEDVDISQHIVYKIDEYKILNRDINIFSDIAGGFVLETNLTFIDRVVDNLLGNAIKFTRDSVWISLFKRDDKYILEVKDNGEGLNVEDINKIFDRFYQVNKSRNKSKNNGYGLGLSIVKQICDVEEWSIEVESELGIGSVFRVRF